jgi:hypothetical protein
MGMFDYIIEVPGYLCVCPDCGATLGGWQSKDAVCRLWDVHYTRVTSFHTICEDCKAFVECVADSPPPPAGLAESIPEREDIYRIRTDKNPLPQKPKASVGKKRPALKMPDTSLANPWEHTEDLT